MLVGVIYVSLDNRFLLPLASWWRVQTKLHAIRWRSERAIHTDRGSVSRDNSFYRPEFQSFFGHLSRTRVLSNEKVFKGLNESTGELFAVKQISLRDGLREEINTLEAEIDLMKDLDHR